MATLKCLHSITKAKNETSFEVVLIDDASSDLDTEKFTALKGIQLIRNRENLGYIQSCNKGATFAKGEFIVQLNNDTLVLDNWLDSLVGTFETFPNVGLVGGLLVFPDASIQEAGGVIWSDAGGLNFGRGAKVSDSTIGYPRKVDYCSGACILLKKTLWDELEGYDSLYAPAYYEDTDLAFRVREVGLHVYYQPRSTIIHLEGLSSGTDESTGTKRFQIINKEKFYNRWKKQLKLHTHENYKDRYCIGNVLFIDAYTPTPDRDSGSQDIMNYMQFFQDCGYKASFLPMMNMVAEGEYTRNLQDKGIEWIGAPSYNTPNEYLSLEGAKYDLVIFYRAHATYVLIDFVRQTCPNAKVIYETVDLHHLRHLREAELNNDPYQFHVANTVKRQEISNILKSDATILLSNYEYDYLKQVINPELLHVIPIARACIGTQVGYQDRQNILFLGGFSHTPNIDCLRYLAEEIMPILLQKDASICLRVVGADITQEILDFACQNIVIDGYIEDLSEVFDSVRMLVAPLRIGAGMKGKVVSALTHALPCVISEIAAEGMNIANYDGVIIENSAEKIVEAILKLYSDSKFWSDMSSTGFAFAQERFSLVGTYDKLYNLIHELSLPIPNDFENIKSTLKI